MSKRHNKDDNRQPGQLEQQEQSDRNRQPVQQEQQNQNDRNRQTGQQTQQNQDNPSRDQDTRGDRENQESEGKGKIATSPPGGERSDRKRI